MDFEYERQMMIGLYAVAEEYKPLMKKSEVFETYRIYQGLVRDEQLIKEKVTSLKYLTPLFGSKYQELMKERIDKAWYLTIEELIR